MTFAIAFDDDIAIQKCALSEAMAVKALENQREIHTQSI